MAKYKLILQRQQEFKEVIKPGVSKKEGSTLGTIELVAENGNVLFKGATCENIGPATDTPMKDKPIVARTYQLEWTDSSKNASLAKKYPEYKCSNGRNKAIWVKCKELPEFASRRILIHVGNFPQDTEGCILVGEVASKHGSVNTSIPAIYKLFKAIENVGIENVELEVRDI